MAAFPAAPVIAQVVLRWWRFRLRKLPCHTIATWVDPALAIHSLFTSVDIVL
jgi:hypothetical protein